MTASSTLPSPTTDSSTTAPATMNTYQWLVILGFPPSVAAARVMPELFTAESPGSFNWDESPRFAGGASVGRN